MSARDVVTQTLTSHAHAVARRLRHDGLQGRTVTIKLKLGKRAYNARASRTEFGDEEPNYPLLSRSRTLAAATDDGALIRRIAIELWDMAAVGEPVRLLGVTVTKLEPKSDAQLELFGTASGGPRGKLGPALDTIRTRFGDSAIRVGADTPQKLTPSMRKKRGE